MSQIELVQNESRAAAAVRTAMAEVGDARTPGELKLARKHLHQAEDKFIKADTRRHRAEDVKHFGMAALFNTAHYQKVAKHHLANLERGGYARPQPAVACPHYVSPEARQRATLGGIFNQIGRLNTQLEGLMGQLATNASSSSSTSSLDADMQRILNDPSLGIEDKIALFMSKYIEKNNQEIENKMKELAAAKNGQNANGTQKKSGGTSFAQKFGKLAGAVIGGMYGGPAGAAVGSKLGGMAGAKVGGSSSTGAAGQANGTQAKDATTLETELQRLTQKREQLIKMLTDLMSALHRTTMSVVNNIKP